MKTIELNRNFKLINVEYWDGQVLFDIDCGRFGQMSLSGDIKFSSDSDYKATAVDVYLDKYFWLETSNTNAGFFNNRNTKLICEALEKEIMEDPESWGYDEYEVMQDVEDTRLFWAEVDREFFDNQI